MARCAMFSAAWSGPTAVGEDCKTHGRSIQIAGGTLIEPRAWALAQPRFLRACACDGVSAPSVAFRPSGDNEQFLEALHEGAFTWVFETAPRLDLYSASYFFCRFHSPSPS